MWYVLMGIYSMSLCPVTIVAYVVRTYRLSNGWHIKYLARPFYFQMRVINRVIHILADITYIRHDQQKCPDGNDIHTQSSTNAELCEQWCSGRSNCAGFVFVGGNTCYLKHTCRRDSLTPKDQWHVTYIKISI